MATSIGAKIELAGERQFRQALSEINTGLRVTSSELALVTAKYADNDKSVVALTAKNEALQNSITVQTAKIQTLKSALEASAIKYGETDVKTLKYAESLNRAETELIKTEKELKDNSKELSTAKVNMEKYGLATDEVAESTGTFGEKLGDIISGLGINLPAGADKAIRSLDATKVSTMALVGVVAGLVTGFAKATIETAQYADEVMTLSKTTGLATDTIQEMNYASELLDVSSDTMTGAMSRMIRVMGDADDGLKTASDSFKKLRINIHDNHGQMKDSERMFYEIVDALGKMKNETERDAIAMDIFGRSARELNPLIEAGSGALKEFGAQAKEMGYVMDGDALEAFGKLDDAMQMFDNQSKAFKNSIAVVLLPILTAFFELLNKIDPKILATVAIIGSVAVVAITVVKGIKSITDTFKGLDTKALKTTAIVVGVVAALIALAAIIAVIVGKSKDLDRTMQGIGQSVGNMTNTINNAPNQVRYSYASGIDYVPSDRVALIHKGERVVRADENPYNPSATSAGGGDTYILQVKMDEVDEVHKLLAVFKGMKQQQRAGEVPV